MTLSPGATPCVTTMLSPCRWPKVTSRRFFFFNDTATTEIYTLSLHDALPIFLWSSLIYTVNAFLIWGGGYFALKGAVDFSGGYVIHLSAGISGFVAAWVIGPRLARDREIDAPNNLAMVAVGAGLLWLGWNGFNGGDPYYAGASASAAVLNTNLATAVAFLGWIGWDYATGRKPTLIGSVNGMITGLVAITPAAGYVNGWGAIAVGIAGSTIVYFAL